MTMKFNRVCGSKAVILLLLLLPLLLCDSIVFVVVFFCVTTIAHELLHLAQWNFAGTCTLF